MIDFQGEEYRDDRLYVLYLCKGEVDISDSENVSITIYHDKAPENHIWCVVTYRNQQRYPLFRVDCFYKKEDAVSYMRLIEPQTPLISLGGRPPAPAPSFEKYTTWKEEKGLKDYDVDSMYIPAQYRENPNEQNRIEHVYQKKSSFQGIR